MSACQLGYLVAKLRAASSNNTDQQSTVRSECRCALRLR